MQKNKNILLLYLVLIGMLFFTSSPMLQPAQATSPQLLWSNESLISSPNSSWHAMEPAIATDSQGNVHIVWMQNVATYIGEIFYTKFDSDGNVIFNNRQLSNVGGVAGFTPSIAIDESGNLYILWIHDVTGTSIHGIMYTRLDANGAIVVNNTFLQGSPGTEFTVDSQGNLLVIGRNNEVTYGKFDNIGNALTPITQISSSFPAWEPLDIKIKTDSNDTAYIVWMEEYLYPSPNPDAHIKYSAISSNGSSLVSNYPLDYGMSHSYNPAIAIDKEDNAIISWDSDFNGGNIYLSKIRKNGTFIFDSIPVLNGTSFGNANVLVDSLKNIDIFGQSHGFTQLDEYGNTIVNTMILGTSQYLSPKGAIDKQGKIHLVWWENSNPRIVKYRKSLNPATISMHGTPRHGSKVKFKLQDIYNVNGSYTFALSTGFSQGISLPDGRKIPLNNDWLFSASISSPQSIGLSRSTGTLDVNNQANVNLVIPNNPSLRGTTMYGAFITQDATGTIISISDPINFTII